MIYDSPSEMVPEQFFGLYVVVIYNYKAIRHILESVYSMPLFNYQYQPLWPFLAELGQKTYFLRRRWWDIDINRKGSSNLTLKIHLKLKPLIHPLINASVSLRVRLS